MWTTLAGIVLFAQLAGLQQYCLCGSCPVSQVLGVRGASTAHVHPCCARAAAKAEAADPRTRIRAASFPCGCGAEAHALRGTLGAQNTLPELREPTRATSDLLVPQAPFAPSRANVAAAEILDSGGPPSGFGAPVYLQTRVLRI